MPSIHGIAVDSLLLVGRDTEPPDIHVEFRCLDAQGDNLPTARGHIHKGVYEQQPPWQQAAEQLAVLILQRAETLIRAADEFATGGVEIQQVRVMNHQGGARGTRVQAEYVREGDIFPATLSWRRRNQADSVLPAQVQAAVNAMLAQAHALAVLVNKARPMWGGPP